MWHMKCFTKLIPLTVKTDKIHIKAGLLFSHFFIINSFSIQFYFHENIHEWSIIYYYSTSSNRQLNYQYIWAHCACYLMAASSCQGVYTRFNGFDGSRFPTGIIMMKLCSTPCHLISQYRFCINSYEWLVFYFVSVILFVSSLTCIFTWTWYLTLRMYSY